MRIGLIAPPWIPVPPPRYGGTEAVVDGLARALVERGHDVRLFTVGTSTCPVPLRSLLPSPPAAMNTSLEEAAHVLAAYAAMDGTDGTGGDGEDPADAVEVIHDHTLLGPLVAGRRRGGAPVVTTVHGQFTDLATRVFAEATRDVALVAISHHQASSARPVPVTAVVHHGVDLAALPAGPGGDHLAFIGRMSPTKGVDAAIRIARRAGRPLVIASKMRETEEVEYFHRSVRPLLGADVDLLIEPDLDQRLTMLQTAFALLNPISWPEPFGLVMAEALATGTPVLGFPRGAAPEIVDHGRTGFLCPDEVTLAAAVERVPDLDRAQCRATAERRFSLQRMAADYERVYRSVRSTADTRAAAPVRAVAAR